MKDLFRKISSKVSAVVGSAGAFSVALLVVVVWALTGPIFEYSQTWQLIINTGTTIFTFLMVFLVQNTQNRDGKAMQLKLDELIRSTRARDAFVDIEDLSDQEIEALDVEFKALHESQKTSPTMRKLHADLIIAHNKRRSVRSQVQNIFHKDR